MEGWAPGNGGGLAAAVAAKVRQAEEVLLRELEECWAQSMSRRRIAFLASLKVAVEVRLGKWNNDGGAVSTALGCWIDQPAAFTVRSDQAEPAGHLGM